MTRLELRELAEVLVLRFEGRTFSGGLGTEWLKSEIEQALRTAYVRSGIG